MAPTVIPFLTVKSVEDTVEFYTTKLGFKLNEANHTPRQFAHVYLGDQVSDSAAQIMLQPPVRTAQGIRQYAPSQILIELREDGKAKEVVDEWYDRIVQFGAVAEEKPEDKPFNCRQTTFKDLDGNDIIFYYWLG
ncbi:hypothetical protein BD410DRAFT_794469 [Rickenella mellea]|uniref:Glyoxalase/fosfomycin resistance/dioxygenase domain-containing protein n=1 Tax=Rickenella mellea TaxID=50990 RepID=A0A4Y7PQB9_9AGAM|nr:hypothetical protein BD410DRAFT_794469 [Rickenella mellea]